jgi:hypothetical protein
VGVFSSPPWAVIMGGKGCGKSISRAEKKNKNCAESGPGTQCRLALCFKILVPAGTRIKFLSAGLKIGVPAGIVLKN